MSRGLVPWAAVAWCALGGCGGGGDGKHDPDAGVDAAVDATVDAGGDAAIPDAGPDAAAPPEDDPWCARLAPGPSGSRDFAIDLSAAHADVRFFGPSDDPDEADAALVAALAEPGALADAATLERYALALEDVCALDADDRVLGPAQVELVGGVALVTPGTGAVVVPPEATAVAVDLRDLPAVPELADAIVAALSPALATATEPPHHRIRRYAGLPDMVFAGRDNVYGRQAALVEGRQIRGSAMVDLPVALLTGDRIAPFAAEVAGTLRLTGRAWIFGRDVPAAVAEARWSGTAHGGISARVAELLHDGQVWPDAIAADEPIGDGALDALLADLPARGNPDPLSEGESTRSWITASPMDVPEERSVDLGLGEARTALIVAHGAVRLFFPYFPVVGDGIDARLLEVLDALEGGDPTSRVFVRDLIRRFGHALSDGHQFVGDWNDPDTQTVPFIVDHIDGRPVVVRSASGLVLPGDTVVGIDGVPVDEWYLAELARTSAASEGYRLDLASRYWRSMSEARTFDLLGVDGTTRTAVVDPVDPADVESLGFAPSLREQGFCDDLGAPTIYYLNLSADAFAYDAAASDQGFLDGLEEAADAAGLVLDMRGYPYGNHYEWAARIIRERFHSPIFRTPIRSDPSDDDVDEEVYPLGPVDNPSFGGPAALLVGPVTVSAAENFSIMLVGAGRVTVVGRPSAATNGNITGVQLPGGFSFSFTGMEILFPDRSRFHGVGIVPDVEVVPTPDDYATGRDPVLEAAIAAVTE